VELLTYTTQFSRARGDIPSLPIINMFAENADPEGKVVLQSRPGLKTSYTVGSGPIRHLYAEPGVFDAAVFAVSSDKLYKGTTLLGTILGDGFVSMDSFEEATFLSAGGPLYYYNGTTLATIPFPDSADTLKVVVGSSRLIVIQKGTQTIYWSQPLTASIDALDFAQAENSPDRLLDMLFLGDTLVLFGEATVEFWPSQADPEIPFAPLPGRVFSKGIKNTGAAAAVGSGFAWVTDSNQLCLNTPDNVVSTSEIETAIEEAGEARLWTFMLDSVTFIALRVGDKTFVFNTDTPSWTTLSTYGRSNFTAWTFAAGYFGSSYDNRVLAWSDDYEDDEGELERRFRIWAPLDMETVVVNNVFLRANAGRTPYTTGQYENPTIEMRTSKDGGNLWTDWREAKMGAIGSYRKHVKWSRLGLFSYPGALAEFRITDPTPFRVSSVKINIPFGGY
jgi:hypothetical protein